MTTGDTLPLEDVGWGAAGGPLAPADVNASLEGISEVWSGAIESPTGSGEVVDDSTSFGHCSLSMQDINGKCSRMTHGKLFSFIQRP